MDAAPHTNDPVVLRDAADRPYASRVEATAPGALTVAQPLDLWVDGAFPDGAEVVVTWTTDRGVLALPTRLVGRRVEKRIRLWDLAVTGAPWVEQRRAYVRVETVGPVLLRRDAAPAVRGELADVSEAALRCSVDAEWFTGVLADDADLHAGFRLADLDFDLPCRVQRHRLDPRSAERVEAVLRFEVAPRQADLLRGQVFALQLRERLGR